MAKEIRIIKAQGQPDQVIVKKPGRVVMGVNPVAMKRKKRIVVGPAY